MTVSVVSKVVGGVDTSGFQETLVSGTNIKTINGNSVLGSGDLVIAAGSITRTTRTSNTILGVGDKGTLIDITSGTFTQTITAAATLGSGWSVYIKNSGTGIITLDPNSTETVDGLTTIFIYPGESFLLECDGTNFNTIGRSKIVSIANVTVANSAANLVISQPFTDTEIYSFDFFYYLFTPSTAGALNLAFSPSATVVRSYITMNVVGTVGGGGSTSGNNFEIYPTSSTSMTGYFNYSNADGTTTPLLNAQGSNSSGGIVHSTGYCSPALDVTSITLSFGSGAFASSNPGTYKIVGYRK